MIVSLMKCEMCEKTHQFEPRIGPAWSQMPHEWLLLMTGTRDEEGLLFCSQDCLKKHLGITITQSTDKPPCKVRRFMLVSEDAELTEAVLWGNGIVSIEGGMGMWTSWDVFKQDHRGSGIQWIDEGGRADVRDS